MLWTLAGCGESDLPQLDAGADGTAPAEAATGDARPIDDAGVLDAGVRDAAVALDGAPRDGGSDGAPPDGGLDAGSLPDGGPRCALEGTWRLVQVLCADMDITDAWRMTVPSSVVVLGTNDGGLCHLAVTHSGPTCTEVQELDEQADGTLLSRGITACDPPACRFVAADEPCVLGDRAGTQRADLTRTDDRFTVSFAADEPAGFCSRYGLPTRETWQLE